jgi:hypothetical protein
MKKLLLLFMICVASMGVSQEPTITHGGTLSLSQSDIDTSISKQLALNKDIWYSGPQKTITLERSDARLTGSLTYSDYDNLVLKSNPKFKASPVLKLERIGDRVTIIQDPPFTLTKEQIFALAETSPQAKEYLKTLYPDLLKEVVDLSTVRALGLASLGVMTNIGRTMLVQPQNNGRNLYGGKSLLVGDTFTAEIIQDGKDQLIIFKMKR